MEFLVLVGLIVAAIVTWRRIDKLQEQVSLLGEALEARTARQAAERDLTQAAIPAAPESTPTTDEQWRSEGPVSDEELQPASVSLAAKIAAPAPSPEQQAVAPKPKKRGNLPDGFKLPDMPKFSVNFEDIFGRLLPIWAGGITLAVAGFFLVRYSIDQGMLTPGVRVALGFLFGAGLLAGAEAANRFADRVTDPRVAQALAGAGLATLYASFYLAGASYGLIGSTVAFIGLAGVTMAAIGLSYRFGLPSAVLGLVGGFAAPMLAGGDEANVPLLATYLGLVTAGLVLTGERQKRAWLGIVALFFGLGWGALLLFNGADSLADIAAVGIYTIIVGAALPAAASKAFGNTIIRLVAGSLATFQMAFLVAQGEFGYLAWALFGLLAAALAFLGWKQPRLREGSAIAAVTSLWLLATWPGPPVVYFAAIASVLTVIFAAVPLAHIKRGAERLVDNVQVCLYPLLMMAAAYWQFEALAADARQFELAATAAILALFPAAAAWLRWPDDGRELGLPTLGALASAAILLVIGALLVTPEWFAPVIGLALAGSLAWLLRGAEGYPARALMWSAGVFTLIALAAGFQNERDIEHLLGMQADANVWTAAVRWAATAGAFAWIAWRENNRYLAFTAEAIAAFFAYGALSQLLPAEALAWMAALGCVAAAVTLAARTGARWMLLAITAAWALVPASQWASHALMSLAGEPMLVSDLPGLMDIAQMLVPLVLAIAAMAVTRAQSLRFDLHKAQLLGILGVAGIAVHVFYKQAFALSSSAEFIALGMAERTVWQVGLFAAAAALWRLAAEREWAKQAAIALAAAGFAHFGLFTLLLHNPLLTPQAVGPAPIANLLLPAYGAAIAALIAGRRFAGNRFVALRPVIDTVMMALISVLALSELRHAFSGTLLTAVPMTQTEDLLRSLLGIVLAIGFLLWGAKSGERSWRIGSLVLILLAVAKVFIFDAAGLEGLARIASFMALGFSLIGIGWFYARQLRGPAQASSEEAATA